MQDRILTNGVRRSQVLQALSPKVQELIILPTEQCNFRCTYCYEDFIIGKMTGDVQQGLKNLIEARVPEIDVLRLSWFGGEPLVAKDVVLQVSQLAFDLCRRYGARLEGGLTTNGYLLKKPLFEKLVDLRQNHFQISLDGDRDSHDTTRLRADGKGTFDRIWENLLALRDCDGEFEVVLRLHVTDANHDSLESLCRKLYRFFRHDRRFTPHFHDVRNLGGEGGKTVQRMDPEVYESQTARLGEILAFGEEGREGAAGMKVTAAPMLGSESSSLVLHEPDGGSRPDDESPQPYICYAARPNSLLIRANGRVGKCTVALNDTRNDIGRLRKDGTVAIDQEKLGPWIKGMETLDLDTLGCPLSRMPKQRLAVV